MRVSFAPPPRSRSFDRYWAAARDRLAAVDTCTLASTRVLPTPTEHYLSGTYPPLKAMGPAEPDLLSRATEDLSIYVHIPFCRQRCTFCHFAKEIRATPDRVGRYLDALVREVAMIRDRIGPRRVSSVYVGGGTPSTLTAYELTRLFAALDNNFPWTTGTEVTFELHPQVVRDRGRLADRFAAMQAAGVNRIAFGIQSLDDRVLRTLNRGHTAAEALDLINILSDSPFQDVSVDLMYGLPYETHETWFSTLSAIVDRGIEKLNIFPLFLKVTDPISRLYERKPELFPDGANRFLTYLLTDEYLHDEGFRSGPVLYYSRRLHHSRQQELKFDHIDDVNLLGLGVSSFGYLGGTQYYNLCDLDAYLQWVEAGRLPLWRAATLNQDELARRTAMFAIRSSGIDRAEFLRRFGAPPEKMLPQLGRFAELGLLTIHGDTWVTTPIGAYCVDGMASHLASNAVLDQVLRTNAETADPCTSLLEQHDYSPIGRSGASVVRPKAFRAGP